MLWAVIMAGGRGTRFWPESREKTPKQFLKLFGNKTLLEQTVERLGSQIPKSRVLVVTSQSKVAFVRKLLKLKPHQVIGEPVGRNTAPCVALAAEIILKKDPKAVLAILPADHTMGKPRAFQTALAAAAKEALHSRMPVTFGIRPTFAFTGYGYLEMGPAYAKRGKAQFYRLKAFHEKPGQKKAAYYFRSKKFLWNSGMFIWHAASLSEAVQRYLPTVSKLSKKIASGPLNSGMKRYFPKMTSISIDYGIMEKLKGKILTLPVDFDWSDVGGWKNLYDLLGKDKTGNACGGQALLVDSSGNLVRSGRRLVVLLGVRDHVVVDTEDALLICSKNDTESIRKVVDKLQADKKLRKHL